MAKNTQTIPDIDAALDKWHARLTMAVRKINALRDKRKKIVLGKIRQPAPKGVKVMIPHDTRVAAPADFDDVIPSFSRGDGFGV